MKKLVTLLLAMVMVLSLAACGGGKAQLKILDTEYTLEDYAIAVAKEDTALLDEINAALAAITADGTTQKIIDKYISGKDHDLTFQANRNWSWPPTPSSLPTSTMRTIRS